MSSSCRTAAVTAPTSTCTPARGLAAPAGPATCTAQIKLRVPAPSEIVAVALSGVMVSVPTIRRRRLGAALRRLREGSGMSLEAVARELGWSTSKVSRIESAKIAVTPADVRALLGVLDALSEEVETLVSLAGEDRQLGWWRQYAEVLPPWFEGYLSLESEASRLLAYESEVVPGLLQTEQYAAEILRHSSYTPLPDVAARAAELRRARQVRLAGPDPRSEERR